jgi:hypothetical protein
MPYLPRNGFDSASVIRKATLGLRTRQRRFVTRKQGVEESHRIETPGRRHLRYDCTQDSHKIFTFDRVTKSVFKVVASAMAISHYAVAFFRAQRNRVTLEGNASARLLFQKQARMIEAINFAACPRDFNTETSCVRQNRIR